MEHLKTIKVNKDTKLYSFKISDMYTNIQIDDNIDIITNKLKTNNENSMYISQLTNTLKIILNQNYFQYKKNRLPNRWSC